MSACPRPNGRSIQTASTRGTPRKGGSRAFFPLQTCFSNLRGRPLRSPHVMRLSLPQTFANRHQRLAQTVEPAAIRAHSLHCESFVRILSGVVTALYEPRDTATSSEYRAP